MRETVTITWFNDPKGFGFIARESGPEVCRPHRAMQGESEPSLAETPAVEFEMGGTV